MNLEGACAHIQGLAKIVHAKKRQCDECVTMGGRWVHLRTCQTCGGTRCCDSSPNQHASRHATSSGHAVACSAEPGEQWLYCYPDEVLAEY